MSATLNVFMAAELLRDGEPVSEFTPYGSTRNPIEPAAVDGYRVRAVTHRLAPGQSIQIYDRTTHGAFVFRALRAKGGEADVSWKVDKPTSSSNDTALGTHINHPKKRLSCFAWETFTTDDARVHANQATYAGSPFPTLEDGLIYGMWVKNFSNTVTIEVTEIGTD
jgi:hypothetical protein